MNATSRCAGTAGFRWPAVPARLESWLLDKPRTQYGSAMLRILLGVTLLASLAVNFPDRQYLWGAGSGWVAPYREASAWNFPPFTVFSAADPDWLLTVKLAVLAAAGAAMTVGWHSRASTITVFILSTSLAALGPTSVDSADNAFRILMFYACFLDTGRAWAIDVRRAGAVDTGVRCAGTVRTAVHNAAVVAVGGQVVLIYTIAGLSKLVGTTWRDGTAVYYPLSMENFQPWPLLNDLLTGSDLLVHAASWGSVALQCLFAPMLLWRPTRIAAVLAMVGMHAGIALSMGLFIFSLAMMAGDVIFIRDRTVEGVLAWLRRRRGAADAPAASAP
jgi:hypothetical protein